MADRRKRQKVAAGAASEAVVAADLVAEPEKARRQTNAAARRQLFVRSLPTTVTSDDLTELFSQDYPIKHATVVVDPATKQGKGYGFVTFTDSADAQRAKDEFNDYVFHGRKIKVEIAEPRRRDADNAATEEAKAAAAAKKERRDKLEELRKPPKLIVRNLPWSIKEPEQLAVHFRKFGLVREIVLPKNKGLQSGFGFVLMRGRKNAQKAMEAVNGTIIDDRTLAVDWAVDRDTWAEQKNAEEKPEDSQPSEPAKASEDENDDVMNFMRAHMDDLEEEEYSDEDEGDDDEDEDDVDDAEGDDDEADEDGEDDDDISSKIRPDSKQLMTDNSCVLFVRNLPYTVRDEDLKTHFEQFGAVRYARIVMDRAMDRPKGSGFVCFFNLDDAVACFRGAPKHQPDSVTAKNNPASKLVKHSILEDENADADGRYTMEGRLLQVARAVNKDEATVLTEKGHAYREERDKDKRRLYLLSEGTIPSNSEIYALLPPAEVKMREESATQRKKLIQSNPSLHVSLTRLSIRNIPRNIKSTDLKALARKAVVEFAKDVKDGKRSALSKEELARGGAEMREAERQRRAKGKGMVKQSKIVFEDKGGSKVEEDGGAGRSRGYGFVEYTSHRGALMGLRWLNGHALQNAAGRKQRLIVEFALENVQVISRRKDREDKARERAKDGKDGSHTNGHPRDRKGKKHAAVDSPEKGTKRKRDEADDTAAKPEERSKLAKREQIIARKRMARRSRKKGGA